MLNVMAAGVEVGYEIPNSLRFRSSASTYLNRTFGAPTNNKIWTYSVWVKRGTLGAEQELLNANSNASQFYFSSTDTLNFYDNTSGAAYYSTQVFRDPSAWYHIIVSVDTTQATAGNRVRIYLNGSQITAFSIGTAPTQNNASAYNVNATVHVIGRYNPSAINYFDGYMADINFIDGQALTPTSFGAFDTTTGVWTPKSYAGTYGTNGFHLNFSNGTSTTTLGYDSSSNSNNWTTNNISLTAGSTYDWMIDSPTPYQGSSYGVGNYAVLNPLNRTGSTFSDIDGNLNWTGATTNQDRIYSTMGMASGKWYWEVTMAGGGSSTYYFAIGVSRATTASTATYDGTALVYLGGNDATISGKSQNRNTLTNATYGAAWTLGDIIGVALDMDAGTLTFYKNGVSQGVAFSSINSTYPGTYFALSYSDGSASGTFTYQYNFGQRPFAYTPPSGYKSLCTYNLPTPTIQNGANYMAATLYTGTGASLTVSDAVNGVSFQPDFVWIKSRSAATDHKLTDSVRGVTKALISNSTAAETTDSTGITAFTSTGFTLGSASAYNTNGATYVAWCWKAGGTAVTNNNGSISSQVSANTTAGFSVVTFTCNAGGSGTFGHGLSIAPSMVIIKSKTTATSWFVGHTSIGWTSYLFLNTTAASAASTSVWNDTAPSSTVVTLGSGFTSGVYGSMVAYCFAAIPGYSAFGSYTGNGSTDGPFVYCGFRPRYILIKRTDSSTNGGWNIKDTSRNPYNAASNVIFANVADAEYSSNTPEDILSNGFKIRDFGGNTNASGGTYIYAAFAENPFQNSLAR